MEVERDTRLPSTGGDSRQSPHGSRDGVLYGQVGRLVPSPPNLPVQHD